MGGKSKESAPAVRESTVGVPAHDVPAYTPLGAADFSWGHLLGHDFVHAVTAAYVEAVHLRRNIFSVPSGKAGKDFVQELS